MTPQNLNEDEIDRRLPVWTILAELFLDTQLDDADRSRIASVLRDSGFRREELDEILLRELVPVFGGNLIGVAGEWTPWRADEVQTMVFAYFDNPFRRLAALMLRNVMAPLVAGEWQRVRALI